MGIPGVEMTCMVLGLWEVDSCDWSVECVGCLLPTGDNTGTLNAGARAILLWYATGTVCGGLTMGTGMVAIVRPSWFAAVPAALGTGSEGITSVCGIWGA